MLIASKICFKIKFYTVTSMPQRPSQYRNYCDFFLGSIKDVNWEFASLAGSYFKRKRHRTMFSTACSYTCNRIMRSKVFRTAFLLLHFCHSGHLTSWSPNSHHNLITWTHLPASAASSCSLNDLPIFVAVYCSLAYLHLGDLLTEHLQVDNSGK